MNRIDIYIKMLGLALPYIRNVQSHGFIVKSRDKSCYYEADLLHSVVNSLKEVEISSWDIYFLNIQARYYIENANGICPNYLAHKGCIISLFNLIPDPMKKDLEWDCPEQ
ncbi:hypothetical protein [Pantoea sp. A4]|uniref:hypothetical protein n=1 Tax=Pantoea sp. A4 TaxID=1225184 RepID=UPI000376548F|nr:hypothetical protein [Pantoea sp. A4]